MKVMRIQRSSFNPGHVLNAVSIQEDMMIIREEEDAADRPV